MSNKETTGNNISSWEVRTTTHPVNTEITLLQIVATYKDNKTRRLGVKFETREQLDKYIQRFMPSLVGKENKTPTRLPSPW
jgi:hypothetical protein